MTSLTVPADAADAVDAVAGRMAEPLRLCVLEVGQARGRSDAAALLAAVPAGRIAALRADIIEPGYSTGELAAALHRLGALESARLFPANADGYFRVFCRHTIAVMLTGDERTQLGHTGADEGAVADRLHDLCAWALMHGWESAVAAALAAPAASAAGATARTEASTRA